MKPSLAAPLLLVALLACPAVAVAAPEKTFALIVTNNRSLAQHRPDLHYADDDGARYYRMFRMAAPAKQVALLTTFDASSERLYPDLVRQALRPTLGELQKTVVDLSRQVEAAKKQGDRTLFYFVFAGHGDVNEGKGYLELEDGKLGPDDLENRIISSIDADVIHLVLDSCNSFFVVNPRKPGGRRWAAPRDMTQGFSQRHPNVGVFLSTSAEAEVYEWSEIQSGIFSHEVRSGLSGAADINGDGRVSYLELESFVADANHEIANESYRPKVFARGPWNQGSSALFTHRWGKGRRILVGEHSRRLWVRDEQGNRLIDLHKDRGYALQLTVPVADDRPLYVQELVAERGGKARPEIRQFVAAPSTDETHLASLKPAPLSVAGRGISEVFEQLFAKAHGPLSHRTYVADTMKRPEMVFGIARNDEARMRHYLRTLARVDRKDRLFNGTVFLGSGLLASGIMSGGLYSATKDRGDSAISLLGLLPLAVNGSLGLYELLRQGEGEAAYRVFEEELERPGASRESVVARTEDHLHALARRDRKRRTFASVLGYVMGAYLAATTVGIAAVERERAIGDISPAVYATTGGLAATFIAYGLWMKYYRTPSEEILRFYREDPDLSWQIGATPIRGGLALGLSATF